MRVFAFFLPQFHEIKENNKWWGEGFTEWTNVKNAQPLFKNHLQPKIPLDGYYNLLDKKTVEYQTKLMRQSNIDGFVYYHYYFAGKKLLEKPAENLLHWTNINQTFFFCWANHSWIKSKKGIKEILLEQTYGTAEDWQKHFDYLLPFFKDKRYEKRNNKPVLMIFKPDFQEKEKMMNFFNQKCKENGFNGIYIINSCMSNKDYKELVEKNKNSKYEQSYFLREPCYSQNLSNNILKKIKRKFFAILKKKTDLKIKPELYIGDKLLHKAIKKMIIKPNIFHGIFFEWDNTPRHKNLGYIITPISKEKFFNYFHAIKKDEYSFINAWNEWAEGMILEGTIDNGYKYLEWITEARQNEKE